MTAISQERYKVLLTNQGVMIKSLATMPAFEACSAFCNRKQANDQRSHVILKGKVVDVEMLEALEVNLTATDPILHNAVLANINQGAPIGRRGKSCAGGHSNTRHNAREQEALGRHVSRRELPGRCDQHATSSPQRRLSKKQGQVF